MIWRVFSQSMYALSCVFSAPQKHLDSKSNDENNFQLNTTSLELMLCPFTGPKMFCAGPNFLSRPKNLTAFECLFKNQFYWMQIIFWSGTKCFWLTQYVNKVLVWLWHKKFGPAQNILGPVKRQGISLLTGKSFQFLNWNTYIRIRAWWRF